MNKISDRFLLEGVILSFPSLSKEYVYNDVKSGNFGASILIPYSDEKNFKLINEHLNSLMKANSIKKLDEKRMCFRDGKDYPDREGHEGHWVLKATNRQQSNIVLLDRSRKEIDITDEKEVNSLFYGGSIVNAYISFWYQEKYEKRINANLHLLQHVADGEPFKGKQRVSLMEIENVIPDIPDEGENDVASFHKKDSNQSIKKGEVPF